MVSATIADAATDNNPIPVFPTLSGLAERGDDAMRAKSRVIHARCTKGVRICFLR
jgi:hypothetical protein